MSISFVFSSWPVSRITRKPTNACVFNFLDLFTEGSSLYNDIMNPNPIYIDQLNDTYIEWFRSTHESRLDKI